MKKSSCLIFAICFIFWIGCKGKPQDGSLPPLEENSSPTEQQPIATPVTPTTPQTPASSTSPQLHPVDLAPVYRRFAGNLYARVATGKEGENFVFSPLAAFQEMGILYLASDGKTRESIQRLFGTAQLKASEMGALFNRLIANQNSTWSFSALWIQNDYPVIKQFGERIEQAFGCKVYSADLLGAKEESLRLINAWGGDMTGDNVPAVVSDYPEQTRLMLTNLLMHRVNWQQPFHMDKTSDQEFTLVGGEKVVKSMMHKTGQFPCYQSDRLQMLVFPYMEQAYRLVIFMPQTDQFAEFEKTVAEQSLDILFTRLQSTPMTLKIPRLEMEETLDLRPFFTKTFENPNLKGMSQSDLEPLTIGPIIQKTLFKMNESGSSEIPPPQELTINNQNPMSEGMQFFNADRPFIFMVWHVPSMTPIIMGRVIK